MPDVVSYNIYPLWYHDTPPAEYLADLYGWVQTTEGRGKPFLVTEIGAGGIYGFRAPYQPKWSEEYQAKALREQLGAVLFFPQCPGVYIRQFCDIRVSDEWWGGRPRTMNNKGVFDEYRRPKLCRFAVEEIFSRKKKRARRTDMCGGRVEISKFPGHMTTMSFAVNCAFRSAGKLSSVMSTSISSICAKV